MDDSVTPLSVCNLPWCRFNNEARSAGNIHGWKCTGKLFKCITQAYGKGCFNHPFYPFYIIDTLCEVANEAPSVVDALELMVNQGLAFIREAIEENSEEMYEVAEVLFMMASVCFRCDVDRRVCAFISRIVRAQMELVTAVTQAGAPWTRQLSISRWFAFLSTSAEDRVRLGHLYPCGQRKDDKDEDEIDTQTKALSYYLLGSQDVIFKLPFKIDTSFPAPINIDDDESELEVPDGFILRDIQMFDFPIRKASDNATFTPLGLACRAVCPKVVSVLLQHGATPLLYRKGMTETPLGQLVEPLGILLRLLNRSWTWRTWSSPEIQDCVLESLKQNEIMMEKGMMKCLKLIMRSVEQVPLKFYKDDDKEVVNKSNGFKVEEGGKVTFFLNERHRPLVPNNRVNSAPELQHLCRMKIRNILTDLRRLPQGVDQLPLTCVLVPYMKLMT